MAFNYVNLYSWLQSLQGKGSDHSQAPSRSPREHEESLKNQALELVWNTTILFNCPGKIMVAS